MDKAEQLKSALGVFALKELLLSVERDQLKKELL